jgi:NADH-quinone oxidoreductase subunit M
MLAHGVSTGALFILVGYLYERRHTREFSEFGGLAKVMPVYAAIFVFVALSSIALPGLNGFVGEMLIFVGAWRFHPGFAAFAVLGSILGAWYMLGAVKRVFFGELRGEKNQALRDLTPREIAIMTPLLAAILVMGVAANSFLDPIRADVDEQVRAVRNAGVESPR